MQSTSRFEPTASLQLHASISDLRWRIQMLETDLAEEERYDGECRPRQSHLFDTGPRVAGAQGQSADLDRLAGGAGASGRRRCRSGVSREATRQAARARSGHPAGRQHRQRRRQELLGSNPN